MKIKIIMLIIFALSVYSKSYAQLDTVFISSRKAICIDSIKTVTDMWRYGSYELNKYKKNIRASRYMPKHEEASKQPPRGYIFEMWRLIPTPINKDENYLLESILNTIPVLLGK